MAAVNFQLKDYQQSALEKFGEFLLLSQSQGAKVAFVATTERPYTPAPGIDEGTPYTCLRVPTGGGKTLMAAHAVGIAASEYMQTENPMVLWLVPSDAIREQTLSALKDLNHPYRAALAVRFGHNLKIMNKTEAQAISRADAEGAACIIVATIQSFRRTTSDGAENPEGLKAYEDSGALMAHFTGLKQEQKDRLECIEGSDRPKASLVNVLKLHRPMIIVDEAHNARTDLSFETLARFSPSLILELTATPQLKNNPAKGEYPSNILYSVSAVDLKEANMIKMPIKLSADSNWERTVEEALKCRADLEKFAEAENKKTGEYIRPIILFQAQANRGAEPITYDVLEKFLTESAGVPREEIAIHTGDHKELDNVDIANPDCKIKYVITVQKLKEGWDCPFAYILCSVAEQGSATAVEQILGRVMRLPRAKEKQEEALNNAYAYVAAQTFDNAARMLIDGLVEGVGFGRIEAQNMVEQPLLDLPGGYSGSRYTGAGSEGLFGGTRAPLERFAIPKLLYDNQGVLEVFTEDHFLNEEWPIHEIEPSEINDYFRKRETGTEGVIDVEKNKDPSVSFSRHLQYELSEVIHEPAWDIPRLVSWLDRQIKHPDITKPSAIVFIKNAIKILADSGNGLDELAQYKYSLRDALREYISKLRSKRQGVSYEQLFTPNADKFSTSADQELVFDEQRYAYNFPYSGNYDFRKHYGHPIGDLKNEGEEHECACHIDQMTEVKYWIRNIDRKPNSFWLQLPVNKFYPDFIALLEDGRILVVEYKGGHLYTDAEDKKLIGDVWAKASNGKCLFCMPTERRFSIIDDTVNR